MARPASPPAEFALLEFEDEHFAWASFLARGWTDGLPVIAPTQSLVDEMLATTSHEPGEVLGLMPTHWKPIYVHLVAVNAVMAGCEPAYFPVVLAALKAALQEPFNLYGVQGTTNPCGVAVLVNGPAARELGVNAEANVFGQGWRANSTIGRAIRLCMINIGGGLPVSGDMATLGDPIKYGLCFAENEAASPWEPFHVEHGYPAQHSLVTVLSAVSPHNIITMSEDPDAVINMVAGGLITSGSNGLYLEQEPLVVFGPTQARRIAAGGFDKQAVRDRLWERGRRPLEGFSETDYEAITRWRAASIRTEGGTEYVYPTPEPSGIKIVVAGGPGPHSAILPTFNGSHICSQPL
jgi:hypothetical protein